MKKLLGTLLCASLLLTVVGCSKKEGTKKAAETTAETPKGPVHPMTYVLDLGDCGSLNIKDNSEYGTAGESTRQGFGDFSQAVKYNKPEVGDKIRITGKVTFPISIDVLKWGLVDDSADAGYWTALAGDPEFFTDVKAGTPISIDYTFDVTTNVVKNMKVYFAYGEQNGEPVTATAEAVAETYVGEIDPSLGPRTTPKVWDMDISKDAAFVEVKPEYPWVDGVQDTTADPQHYQAVVHIGHLFGGELPIAGDTINLTWKFQANHDIEELWVRLVENTGAVNWWAEIDELAGQGYGTQIATDIKAGEPKVAKGTLKLGQDPVEGLSLCVVYPLSACDGGAIFKYAK